MSRVLDRRPVDPARRRARPQTLRLVTSAPAPGGRPSARLAIGSAGFACAIGRGGLAVLRREGDGTTPIGRWPLRALLYRPDRGILRSAALPAVPVARGDGWCDDPSARAYNRPVELPFAGSHEVLWRDDGLYDLVVVLDCNLTVRVRPRASAIFLHVASPGLAPTQGCVALSAGNMVRLLARLRGHAVMVVGPVAPIPVARLGARRQGAARLGAERLGIVRLL